MRHTEFGRMPVQMIGGPFAVYVVCGDSIIASHCGITELQRAEFVAADLARQYCAPIIAAPRFLVAVQS